MDITFQKLTSLAIELETGNILFPNFLDDPPDRIVRGVRYMGPSALCNVFDNQKCELAIKCFPYKSMNNLPYLLQMPDHEFIKNVSTSPEAEGPNFIQHSRIGLKFLHENQDWKTFFKNRNIKRFQLQQDGTWI